MEHVSTILFSYGGFLSCPLVNNNILQQQHRIKQCFDYFFLFVVVMFEDAVLFGLSHETAFSEKSLSSRNSFAFATVEKTVRVFVCVYVCRCVCVCMYVCVCVCGPG